MLPSALIFKKIFGFPSVYLILTEVLISVYLARWFWRSRRRGKFKIIYFPRGLKLFNPRSWLASLAEYAKRENIEIAERFIESKSAKKPGWEIFNEMIQRIYESKEPVGILAWHPNHLARNSVDGGQVIYLIDIGEIASLRFPTLWFESTPQGLFMLQVPIYQKVRNHFKNAGKR